LISQYTADRYRVYKQVIDEDRDSVAVVTVTNSASLWDLPSGETANTRVASANAAEETQPSGLVSIAQP